MAEERLGTRKEREPPTACLHKAQVEAGVGQVVTSCQLCYFLSNVLCSGVGNYSERSEPE